MGFEDYVAGIAEARYAIRKVFRIVDDQAKSMGLDPLEHQALIQISGAPDRPLSIGAVGERLDISAAFTSRVVRRLEDAGYVMRRDDASDGRVINVHITELGQDVLQKIDSDVRARVAYFQSQLPRRSKVKALSVLGFYVGLDLDEDDVQALVSTADDLV